MDHALGVTIEHPFEARYTPRNCILDIVRDLRFEVEDSEDKTGKELDGWEIGGCPLSWRRCPWLLNPLPFQLKKKHGK